MARCNAKISTFGNSMDLLHRQTRSLALCSIVSIGRRIHLVAGFADYGASPQALSFSRESYDSSIDVDNAFFSHRSCDCTTEEPNLTINSKSTHSMTLRRQAFPLANCSALALTFLNSFSASIRRFLSFSSSLTASILAISNRSASAWMEA